MAKDAGSLDAKLLPERFVEDVTFAGRALLSQPQMILVPIVLWTAPVALARLGLMRVGSGGYWFLQILVMLLWFGWCGAERIFFLRRLQQTPVTIGELFGFVPSFMGRFLRLALLMATPFTLAGAVACVVEAPDLFTHLSTIRLVAALVMAVGDFALTFVTPALAFTTRSVWQAVGIGFRMIRQTWPRSALYVLCPPLAVNFVNVIFPMHQLGLRLSVAGFATLLGLVAKGATAAFYLREKPISGPDGAAHLAAGEEPYRTAGRL